MARWINYNYFIMETVFPQLETEEFILEQVRAPEESPKYPLPPEIIKILEIVRDSLGLVHK